MPEIKVVPDPPKKRFMFESNNETDENVSPPLLDWPMIWISNEFARPLRRISVATVLFKTI